MNDPFDPFGNGNVPPDVVTLFKGSLSWWDVGFSWANSAHGLNSKRHWPGYSNGGGSAVSIELDCTDCHDPHGSYDATTNTDGNPYMIRDEVDGTSYADDGVRGNPSASGTMGVKDSSVVIAINKDDEIDWRVLCQTCHDKWKDVTISLVPGSPPVAIHFTFSTNCHTCHRHGETWGETDWGPKPDNHTVCP